VRDDASVNAAMQGADAVVNCVGVLVESGKNSFDAVQAEAPTRIARLAAENNVARMVHISAIGADAESDSEYARSKAEGEAGVLEHMPNSVILRPSVVFGSEDEFFNRFAGMTRMSPVLPVAHADSRFQPVYVDDVAQAAEIAVKGEAHSGVYELGGPDTETFRALMQRMLGVIHRRRLILNLPGLIAWMMAFGFDMLQSITFGLFTNGLLTRDQLKNLKNDNVVSEGAMNFATLGISPVSMTAVLPDYLWRFRPSGQYDAIKDSARNLRNS
jgi:NADH dehydrogenase